MNSTLHGQSTKIVIAHRGASGYLPEHTLESKALAYGMGAHYLEQDLVLTKDDHPIVMHDIHLDEVTDVATRFPERVRDDGRFYALDFTLAEIQSLRVSERFHHEDGKPVFPGRFPVRTGKFQVPSLAEELQFIQGMNEATGKTIGIYPEIKSPAWHRKNGKDISRVVLKTLAEFGYDGPDDPVFLQCFDRDELRRIHVELECKLKKVQLLLKRDQVATADDFARIAEYADGVGPDYAMLFSPSDLSQRQSGSPFVRRAHEAGLVVHPWTFRTDALPDYVDTFEQLLDIYLNDADVDGMFTDFPDRAVRFLQEQ